MMNSVQHHEEEEDPVPATVRRDSVLFRGKYAEHNYYRVIGLDGTKMLFSTPEEYEVMCARINPLLPEGHFSNESWMEHKRAWYNKQHVRYEQKQRPTLLRAQFAEA